MIEDDDLRWETSDGESPSTFGCFGIIVPIAAIVFVIVAFLLWRWSM